MSFNKEMFIKENGEFLYGKLIDFLECEVNKRTREDIIYFLSNKNTDNAPYEGNQYLIVRENDAHDALIIDGVSEEHGVSQSQSRFTIAIPELLELIEMR